MGIMTGWSPSSPLPRSAVAAPYREASRIKSRKCRTESRCDRALVTSASIFTGAGATGRIRRPSVDMSSPTARVAVLRDCPHLIIARSSVLRVLVLVAGPSSSTSISTSPFERSRHRWSSMSAHMLASAATPRVSSLARSSSKQDNATASSGFV